MNLCARGDARSKYLSQIIFMKCTREKRQWHVTRKAYVVLFFVYFVKAFLHADFRESALIIVVFCTDI